MISRPRVRSVVLGMILVVAVALASVLSGCGADSKTADAPPLGTKDLTALQALKVAQDSIESVAPDARVLIVTTTRVVEPTATPEWQFLLGSPASNMTYAVVVTEGQAMASPYTTSTLSADEWAALPSGEDIKVDSDEARSKALKAYPDGTDDVYVINLLAGAPGVPTSSLTKPMTWVVMFDPTRASGDQTSTVEIDATTGKVTVPR